MGVHPHVQRRGQRGKDGHAQSLVHVRNRRHHRDPEHDRAPELVDAPDRPRDLHHDDVRGDVLAPGRRGVRASDAQAEGVEADELVHVQRDVLDIVGAQIRAGDHEYDPGQTRDSGPLRRHEAGHDAGHVLVYNRPHVLHQLHVRAQDPARGHAPGYGQGHVFLRNGEDDQDHIPEGNRHLEAGLGRIQDAGHRGAHEGLR